MSNIQEDNILDILEGNDFSVNFQLHEFAERLVWCFEQICSTHLSVDKLVAKLRKKQFGVFLSDFMKILTNPSI